MDPNVSNSIYLDCGENLTPRGHKVLAHTSTFCDMGMMDLVRKFHLSAGLSACKSLHGSPGALCSCAKKGPLLFLGAWVL